MSDICRATWRTIVAGNLEHHLCTRQVHRFGPHVCECGATLDRPRWFRRRRREGPHDE